jgi:hypothetical protein
MNPNRFFAAFGFATLLAAVPAFGADSLIKFEDGIGSQPFRSASGVPALNAVAGVNPGGAPWVIKSLKAVIKADGRIVVAGKGLLLGGGDNVATRGGPRQVVASLFCRNAFVPPATAGTVQTVPYNSAFVDLDPDGDFKIDGVLTNPSGAVPPSDCGDKIDNRPVLLIRSVTPANPTTGAPATPGSWFAAGIVKE